jgi:hypothetical protein
MTDVNYLIIILPNYYSSASNGHVAALRIYKTLCACIKEPRVLAVSGAESRSTVELYRQIFNSHFHLEDSEFIKSVMRRSFSILCPDDIEGSRSMVVRNAIRNPACRQIHVIGFAPLGIFAPQGSFNEYFCQYDERFRLAFFDDWIAPVSLRDSMGLISIYQEPAAAALDTLCELNAMTDVAIYCGKGLYRLSSRHQNQLKRLIGATHRANHSIHLITRDKPIAKEDLYRMLARCLVLICLDPFSNIEREAASLGCTVWKPNCPAPGKIPGIQYGDLNTEATIAELNMEREGVLKRKSYRSQTLRTYSRILDRASRTKLDIYIKAIEACMRPGATSLTSFGLAKRTIIPFTSEIVPALKAHTARYMHFIHPIPGSSKDYDYPAANNSISLESALNLLMGTPKTEDELLYAKGLESINPEGRVF